MSTVYERLWAGWSRACSDAAVSVTAGVQLVKRLDCREREMRVMRTLAARPPSARPLALCIGRRGLSSSASSIPDPWTTLGVPRTADIDECKAAFRTLALSLHPDVSPHAADAAKFAAVVEAFESIEQGRAVQSSVGRRGPRSARVVGGMLIVSVDVLRQDPAYEVHTVRVRFGEADERRGDDLSTLSSTVRGWPTNARHLSCAPRSVPVVHP